MSGQTARALTVEARSGSLDLAFGTPSRTGDLLPMDEWKRIVTDLVASDPGVPLRVVYFGGANQITGYRLYYMLQFAKAEGVRHLSLFTDGRFWIDEATEWLIDSRVDEIVLIVPPGGPTPNLKQKMSELERRSANAPAIAVRPAGADALL